MSRIIRIVIVDDHPLWREGVARSLHEIGGFEISGQGGSARDARRLVVTHRPDIVLLDIAMPGGGMDAAAGILTRDAHQKVVMLTVSETNTDVANAIKAGARGYVLKGVGSRTLAAILHDVMAGKRYVPPSLGASLLLDLLQPQKRKCDLLQELTGREMQILRLVSEGDSNKLIANRLSLQEKTVKHHMTRVMAKLKVRNRTEAAVLVQEANSFADQV